MTNSINSARARALLLAVAATAIAMLVSTAAAQAQSDPIASGSTDLHVKKGMQRKLANNGINIVGLGATTVTGSKIGLVVREGQLDPTNVQGQLQERGGFKLTLNRRGVPFTAIEVNTVRGAVYAKVAGARMQIGTFATPSSTREGFGTRFKAAQLTLTEKVANRISNRLGLRGSKRIKGGRVLSNLFAIAQPGTVTLLPQGGAILAVDQIAAAKLKAKGVDIQAGLTPVPPATEPTPLAFQLPISGGDMQLSPTTGGGEVSTGGGVQILKTTKTLSPQLLIKSFQLNLFASSGNAELEINPRPPFGGDAGRSFGVTLTIPDNAVVTNPTTRQIEVKGVEAKLQAGAASILNNVLNQPAPAPPASSDFVIGDPLGTFTLTAQAQ